MKKIYIWGSGYICDRILSLSEKSVPELYRNNDFFIAGIIDNDQSKWGETFHGRIIVSPKEAIDMGFDLIIVLLTNIIDVMNQAQYGYGVSQNKIKDKTLL